MKINKKVIFMFVLMFIVVSVSAMAMGSSLTIMQNEGPMTMDPSNHTATYTQALLSPMFDTLTEFDRNMKKILPCLATDWQISDDAKEWTFTIREGVTFHDGTKLDANAVKKSFDRVMDPNNGLATRSRLTNIIESIEVVDEYTVIFHLIDSYPAFLNTTSYEYTSIISPIAIDKGSEYLARNAVGTGPYTFVEWVSGEKVVMKKNANYWGEVPGVDELVWKWTAELSVLVMAVQTGEADIIFPAPPAYAKTLGASSDINFTQAPGNRCFWIALNTLQKELQDVRVRQALNYAIDREALINSSVLFGCGMIANSPVGPNLYGYDPDCPAYLYDLEKAKALLAEAGYKDGFELPIASQEPDASIVEILKSMWSKIGVDVQIHQMESGVWQGEVFSAPENNKGFSVIASWSSCDASGYLDNLFHTKKFAPAGANLGFYSNEKVDQLLDKAARTVDNDEREKLYFQAQRIIQEEAAHVSLFYANNLLAMNKRVDNVYVRVDGQLCLQNPKIKD